MNGEETRNYRIYGISMVILCPFMFTNLLMLGIYQQGLTLEMTGVIAYIISVIVELVRIFHLWGHPNDMRLLCESMAEAMKLVKNDKFITQRLEMCLKMFILVVLNAYLATIAGFITSFTSIKPYPYGEIFDENESRFLSMIYNLYSQVIVFYVAPMFATMGFLPIFFMNFIIGFMEDFNERLEKFGCDDQNMEKMSKELKEIVEIHEKIQVLVKKLVDLFQISFFIVGITGSFALCLSAFVIPLVRIFLSIYTFYELVLFLLHLSVH